MARSRNIKPAFFDNDLLAENEPLGRLLFIGLWTLADHHGNLEWRSKRIKKQILAYDDCDVEALAINLDKSGFIRFYSDGEKTYINIVNFVKHQNPHKNERDKGSDIPLHSEELAQLIDFDTLKINPDKSGLKRNYSDSNRADSPILIPDSLILNPETLEEEKDMSGNPDNAVYEIFTYWKEVMRKSANAKCTPKRSKKIIERLKQGYTLEQIKQGIDGCKKSPHHMGQNDSGTVYDDLELILRSGEKLEGFIDKLTNQQVGTAKHDPNHISTNFDEEAGGYDTSTPWLEN